MDKVLTCVASVQNIQATSASLIVCTYTGRKVETETVTVTATPSSCLEQSLNFKKIYIIWIVLAILFLMMVFSAIVLSIIIGCIFHKRKKTLEYSRTCMAASTSHTYEPVKEGTVSHITCIQVNSTLHILKCTCVCY